MVPKTVVLWFVLAQAPFTQCFLEARKSHRLPMLTDSIWNRSRASTISVEDRQREKRQLLEELREELKKLPKLEFQLRRTTVYSDGVTMEARVVNRSEEPMRLSLVYLPSLLRHQIKFKDAGGDSWKVTGLKNRYQFDDTDSEMTCVIDALGHVDLFIVHNLEEPTVSRVEQKDKVAVDALPKSLRYSIEVLPTIAHKDTQKPRLVVRLIGEGATDMEWSNKGMPAGSKTVVRKPNSEDKGK